jgi:hypothetical protein
MLTGVPAAVTPRSTRLASSRATWLTTRTLARTSSSPMTWRSSSPRLGRCSPVATRIVTASRGTPAARSRSRIGASSRPLGTGRVTSHTTTQAERAPAARVASGGAATGASSAAATAARGSARGASWGLRSTSTWAGGGTCTRP